MGLVTCIYRVHVNFSKHEYLKAVSETSNSGGETGRLGLLLIYYFDPLVGLILIQICMSKPIKICKTTIILVLVIGCKMKIKK